MLPVYSILGWMLNILASKITPNIIVKCYMFSIIVKVICFFIGMISLETKLEAIAIMTNSEHL